MKKVICFARVSTIQQNLDAQLEAVKNAAISDRYTEDEILIVQGKESAIKLDEEQRQTLNEVKELVANNPTIETIYYFAVDRLARRMSIIMNVVEWAIENKINLVFLHPHRMSTFRINEAGVKVEDEVTKLLLAMLSYGAEMEMKVKKARFAVAKQAMKLQGKLPQGKPIKGYYLDDKRNILVHPEESKFIINIFKDYLDNNNNESLLSLHEKYVAKGFFEPSKSPWRNAQSSRIYNVLKDCSYCGREKELVKKYPDGTYKTSYIKYPAIISEELFDAVQDKLRSRQREPKKILKNIYYAKGLVRCGECGHLMRTDTNSCTYSCKERLGHTLNVNMNMVDNLTWLTAKCCWNIYNLINGEEQRATYTTYVKDYKHKVEILEKEIAEKYAIIDRTNERFLLGKVKEAVADKIIDECTDAINKFNIDIVRLKAQIEEYEKLITNIDNQGVLNPRKLDALNDIERCKLINDVIDSVIINRIDSYVYTVYFKFKPILENFRDAITPEVEYWKYHSYNKKLYSVKRKYDIIEDKEVIREWDCSFHLEEKRHKPRQRKQKRDAN